MDTVTVAIIVAGISFLGTVLSLIVQYDRDKKAAKKAEFETRKIAEEAEKIKAETEEINVQTALSLVTPLRKRISELETELKAVIEELKTIEKLLTEKDSRIEELNKQILYLTEENSRMRQEITDLKNEIKGIRSATPM